MVNIFIVDDVKFTCVNLSNILKDLNHKHIEILNKNEQIPDFLESSGLTEDTNIIFLSLNLSISQNIQNSIELIKKIKTINSASKIIAIAENGKQQEILKAMQAGASEFIEKPLKKDKVEQILKKV